MLRITLVSAAAVCFGVIAWWTMTRRRGRRRVESASGLAVAQGEWWRTVRSFGSEQASFAFCLRAYGRAALACSEAVAALEHGRGGMAEWHGPPPQPRELRPAAGRSGPPELWRQFDHAYEACYTLLHPADHCLALGQAAIVLADWIERHKPAAADSVEERSGPDAAFVHAVSAPCLAASTAESMFQQEGKLRIDAAALHARIEEEGTAGQRTMMSLAAFLIGLDQDGPTVSELLRLEDTDLCHALEALALARELRRVYPPQGPELLWMQAALADSGAQNQQKGADDDR